MNLTMRQYQTENDWWRIREFLRQVFLLNGRRAFSWHISRLDYWRWHGIENMGHGKLENDVFIWETSDGHIAAVLNRERPGDTFLQIHPSFRSTELVEEMIVTAEKHLAHTRKGGKRKLCVWVDSRDVACQRILTQRGFSKGNEPEYLWRRTLDALIPDAPIPNGYTVRALGDGLELHPLNPRVLRADAFTNLTQGFVFLQKRGFYEAFRETPVHLDVTFFDPPPS